MVGNGSGAFNLLGLTSEGTGVNGIPLVWANIAILQIGNGIHPHLDAYIGFTGPTNFGSGGEFFANIGSGDFISLQPTNRVLYLPMGYVSNTALTDSMTFTGATFASLGLTPGTHEWTWGDGRNQNFTLIIGQVPDGGTTVSLLGFALLGLVALRRRLGC